MMTTFYNSKTIDDIKQCFDRKDDIYQVDIYGETPLSFHCGEGNTEIVEFMLTFNEDVRNQINLPDQEMPPLHNACYGGHMDIFDILISHGADLELKTDHQSTPLMFACLDDDQTDIIDKLLTLNVNVNAINSEGENVLFYTRSLDTLHKLYVYGIDINHQDNNGNTPLISAVRAFKSKKFVQCLIDYGANINIVNNEGYSAVYYAMKYPSQGSDDKMATLLFNAGADIPIQYM